MNLLTRESVNRINANSLKDKFIIFTEIQLLMFFSQFTIRFHSAKNMLFNCVKYDLLFNWIIITILLLQFSFVRNSNCFNLFVRNYKFKFVQWYIPIEININIFTQVHRFAIGIFGILINFNFIYASTNIQQWLNIL